MGKNKSLRESAAELFQRLHRARYHYRKTFQSNSGKYVLQDLSKFVHLNDDLYREDIRVQDYLLGQRRVILRVIEMIGMEDEQIQQLTKHKDIDEI